MIGVQGNEAAQARVFAHDAITVVTDARVLWLELDTLKVGTGYAAGVAATTGTGVPGAFDVNITSVDANGSITGIAINTASTAGVDGSIAAITGGNNDAFVTIRTTFPGSNQRGCCLYVGGAGDVNVTLESGSTVIFAGVNGGSFLPICATQVLAASTTATNMLALY
tara:strand:- start:47 stop:547 length:501 start_codon:yes stop_codon:yes gene_type:complete